MKAVAMIRTSLLAILILKSVECVVNNECGTNSDLRQLNEAFNEMNRRMVDMERVVEKLRTENTKMNKRLVACENKESLMPVGNNSSLKQRTSRLLMDIDTPVAFLASLNAPAKEEHLGVNQNIIFDTLLTNIGGAFNSNHGIFIVPQSGIYLISTTVLSYVDNEVRASIMVNGQRTVSVFAHAAGGRHEQGTQLAVLKLNVGDSVSVQNIDLADISIWGERYTSFTGVLLYPME